MDTNPMEDDHWWYDISKKGNLPKGKFGWKFFEQPGGVREVNKDELPDMPEANGYTFSAGTWWKENEVAENINNLPSGYYTQILAGKSKDWIRCYAEGKYTFVQDGKPVWSEYDDGSMCVERLEPDPAYPIIIGLDFGLTPAAVFCQRLGNGRWHILHELVTFDMGLERFGQILKSEIEIKFPKYDLSIWGDPAGSSRDQIYEVTAFEHLKSLGILAKPTATNDFKTRREAVAAPMTRLIQGKPGFLIDSRCNRIRKSLSGGYHYKRVQISGQERFKDQPNKNQHSHVGDALGYALLGGGEFKRLTRPNQTGFVRAALAKLDFDLW